MLITIKNDLVCAVVDSFGAEIKSLKNKDGVEFLWQADPAYWGKTSPVLFPNVGVLPDNCAKIGGQYYSLRRHGFARDMEFQVTGQKTDRATFTLSSNGETLLEFPFPFRFTMTYSLSGKTLVIGYGVENTGSVPMYFKLGAHPAFNCPILSGEAFSDYSLVFPNKETANCPVMDIPSQQFYSHTRTPVLENQTTLSLSYSLFPDDALIFDSLVSDSVSLIGPSGLGITMGLQDFDLFAVWTPPGMNAPFLCLEPWNGSALHEENEDGMFEHLRGVQCADPGESRQYQLPITLLGDML